MVPLVELARRSATPMSGRLLILLDQHKRFAWILAALLPLIWGTYWVFDRSPPFRIEGTPTLQPTRAGEELLIHMKMTREMDRRCSAVITRYFVDSTGTRRGMSFETLNFEGLQKREAISSTELKLALPTPRSLPSGPTQLFTDASYTCATNPLTYLAPIRVTSVWEFTTLPPLKPEAVVVITKPEAVEKTLRSLQPQIPVIP